MTCEEKLARIKEILNRTGEPIEAQLIDILKAIYEEKEGWKMTYEYEEIHINWELMEAAAVACKTGRYKDKGESHLPEPVICER